MKPQSETLSKQTGYSTQLLAVIHASAATHLLFFHRLIPIFIHQNLKYKPSVSHMLLQPYGSYQPDEGWEFVHVSLVELSWSESSEWTGRTSLHTDQITVDTRQLKPRVNTVHVQISS